MQVTFLLAVFALCSTSFLAQAAERIDTRPLMGTVVQIVAEAADDKLLAASIEAAFGEMNRLSDMMNHYDPGSAVSEINRQAGIRPVAVPQELMTVLRAARRLSEWSDGAFDITVGSIRGWRFRADDPRLPTPEKIQAARPLVNWRDVVLNERAGTAFLRRAGQRMDLGGIAKLPILEAGMNVLRRHGIRHAMINGGGDIVAQGGRAGLPWRIGLRHPRDEGRLLGTLELTDGFVTTSGDYERYFMREGKRYHHILDPRTGYPAASPQQVTLVGRHLDNINGLGVAIMVRGAVWARERLGRQTDVDALIVEPDGGVWATPSFSARYRYHPSP
jgi:thiamine biosynthesis lipoprotein